jgi:hypothetical protein
LAIGTAWLIWILIDLFRLGVISGDRSLDDAVFDMPSVGIPLLLAIVCLIVAANVCRRARRKRAFPTEPWMWEKRWNRTGARPLIADKLVPDTVLAVVSTVLALAMALIGVVVIQSPLFQWAITPVYVFAAILWVRFARTLAPVLKFGRPFFRYETFPFFPGGQFAGALEGIERIHGFDDVTVVLRSVKELWTRSAASGRHIGVSRSIVREEVRHCSPADVVEHPVDAGGRRSLAGTKSGRFLPVRFDVSAGESGTKLGVNPAIKWELQVTAQVPGLDYDVTFLVPVYEPPVSATTRGLSPVAD